MTDGNETPTTKSPALLAPGADASRALATQLAAVELLVRRQDRDVARDDILMATVFEILERGDRSAGAIHTEIQRIWPGVTVTIAELEAVLSMAKGIQHVEQRTQLDGTQAWSLLTAGRDELDNSRAWAEQVQARFRSQLADEARAYFGVIKYEDLDLWLGLLVATLRKCIEDAFAPGSLGGVDAISGKWLHPLGFNLDSGFAAIDQRVAAIEVAEFLKSALLLALDPTATFGSELVHHLVTGYLLYLFMAAQRATEHKQAAGPLQGERLILDTPVLFHMTRPASQTVAMKELVALARRVNMEVVLYERTLEEFSRKLDNHERFDVPTIEADLNSGTDPLLLAEFVRDDELLRNWLLHSTHRTTSWKAFREQIEGKTGPLAVLKAMGVLVLEDEPFDTIADTAQFEALRTSLTRMVTGADGKPRRSRRVIDHDAALLHNAHKAQDRNPQTPEKVWPGAFILSTDNHLNDCYDKVFSVQTIPVALSFSAFTAIAAAYAPPTASEETAFKVAGQLAEVTIISRSTLIPLELARELAVSLSGEASPHASDIQQLELSVMTLIRNQPDLFDKSGDEYRRYVGEVLESRRSRLTDARAAQAAEVENERHRVELAQTRQAGLLHSERLRRIEAESALSTTLYELNSREDAVQREHQAGQRKAMIAALVAVAVTGMVLFALAGHWTIAAFLLLAAIVMGGVGWGWATRDSNGWPVIVAAGLTAVIDVWGLFF